MLKNKLNRRFRQIIALSTLAAVGCSSDLIQNVEAKHKAVDLILGLTQEDRQKLLELLSKQETVDIPTDFNALNYPCTLSRYPEMQDNDLLDDVGEPCRGWIVAQIKLTPKNNDEEIYFDLLKNKKDNKIYFMGGMNRMRMYLYYEKLKDTEFNPEKYENRIWYRPKDFEKLCDKLYQEELEQDEQKRIVISKGFDHFASQFNMSPKVGLGIIVALGAVTVGGLGLGISKLRN